MKSVGRNRNAIRTQEQHPSSSCHHCSARQHQGGQGGGERGGVPQLEVLAALQGELQLGLALDALQSQDDLLGGLSLLVEDRLAVIWVSNMSQGPMPEHALSLSLSRLPCIVTSAGVAFAGAGYRRMVIRLGFGRGFAGARTSDHRNRTAFGRNGAYPARTGRPGSRLSIPHFFRRSGGVSRSLTTLARRAIRSQNVPCPPCTG
jgi:hypothetical protein